ncbi:MAG: OsmC family protein [Gemmatimonadota bacterium]
MNDPSIPAVKPARILTFHPTVEWTGNQGTGTSGYGAYSRAHTVSAPGKEPLAGSSDPLFRGDPTSWSPEELLVAALSACHMLWYLHLCADAGVVVTAYHDAPEGKMPLASGGRGAFSEVILRPRVRLAPGSDVRQAEAIHQAAHQACFIAASVNFPVGCEPTVEL